MTVVIETTKANCSYRLLVSKVPIKYNFIGTLLVSAGITVYVRTKYFLVILCTYAGTGLKKLK